MPAPVPTSAAELDFTPRQVPFPSPRDWRDHFIYHLLIDRFDDNNRDTPPYDPATAVRGRDAANAYKFQGGRLKGITRRLAYLQDLGCTAVWISPPFKNRVDDDYSYHGYGIQHFLDVDPRYGTVEDLQELVREAHRRGMYVILDIVINHTADGWAYPGNAGMPFNESGRYDFGFWRKAGGGEIPPGREGDLGPDDGVWPVELQHPDAYKRRGQIRDFANYTPEEGIDGDFVSLKDLDLSKPEVLDALIRCYKYWIAIADVDGYRLDTVTHTEPTATAIFCNAIREYCKSIGKDNFFLYAEIVADDQRLRRYVGTNMPTADEGHERYPTFSAVLDFPMYFVLEEVIKGYKTPDELHERYESFRRFYRDFSEAGQYFVTFVDNHDQMSRPYRRFANNVSDHHLSILAVGYLLTNMGIPCVYYGTEQSFDGGGDSDVYVRECMFGGQWGAFDTTNVQFFNPESPVYKAIGRIARVRAREPALRYGREYFRQISGDGEHFGFPNVPGKSTIAFSRVLDVDEVLVCLNLDPNDRSDYVMVDKKLTPPGTAMTDLLNAGPPHKVEANRDGEAYVRVPLMGHRMAILKREA